MTFCLLPRTFRRTGLAKLDCRSGSHLHVSRDELRELRDLRLVETEDDAGGNPHVKWLREPDSRRHIRGAVRVVRKLPLRGLSAQIGAPLAIARAKRSLWAVVLIGQIRARRA